MYPFYDKIHGYFDIRRYRVKGVAKILTSIIFIFPMNFVILDPEKINEIH